MDNRDNVIGIQVAFKGAIDMSKGADLSTEPGQGEFKLTFDFLKDTLLESMTGAASPTEQAAQIIRGNFPGTTNVASNETPGYNPPPQYANGQQHTLTIKGQQHGPIPPWMFEAAAAAGVTEVYDNRDRAATNPKYPQFKATSGGPNATPFWAPRG